MSRTYFATALAVISIFAFSVPLHGSIQISNLRAAQRPGTTLVDIHFDMTALAPVAEVMLMVSDGMIEEGGGISLATESATGHLGGEVPAGVDRHIVWDAGEDWGLWKATMDMRFVVGVKRSSKPTGGDSSAVEWHRVNERWVRNYYSDGSATMTDLTTGQMWMDDAGALGTATWSGAVSRVEAMRLSGYEDWVLPDRNLLAGIQSQKKLFRNVADYWYWSGDPSGDNAAWTVTMRNASMMSYVRGAAFWVWGCRDAGITASLPLSEELSPDEPPPNGDPLDGEPPEEIPGDGEVPTGELPFDPDHALSLGGIPVDTASKLADFLGSGIPSVLEDWNGNGTPDAFEDWNGNGIPDAFEDFSGNGIPDAFEDFNGSGIPDAFEDFSGNGIPDAFEMDFNGNGIPDVFEFGVIRWVFIDYSGDGYPDALRDFSGNGIPDAFEDFSGNGIPDAFEDFSGNGIPDAFEDFSGNGIPDAFEDFSGNGIPDAFEDFSGSGIPDAFESRFADTRGTGLPDFFEDSHASKISSPTHPDRRKSYFETTFAAFWNGDDFPGMVNGWLWVTDRDPRTTVGLANGVYLPADHSSMTIPARGFGEHWFHLVPLDGASNPISGKQVRFRFQVEINAPVITSPSHPEGDYWYNNPDFVGEWTSAMAAQVVTGWRWMLSPDEPYDGDLTWMNSSPLGSGVSALEFNGKEHGSYWLHLAPVDIESRIINERGSVFRFNVNRKNPSVTSPSHPVETVFYPIPNVRLSWHVPDVSTGSLPFYYTAWNDNPWHEPSSNDEITFSQSTILPGQSNGVHYFHVVGLDRLGNPTGTGRHRVNIGEAQPPVAGFSADLTEGPGPLTVTFVDESHGNITVREWDFTGNGEVDAVNPPSPVQWTYPSRGSYTVTLTVSGPGGGDIRIRPHLIKVLNSPPVAAVVDQRIFLDDMGGMAALDASPSTDPDGDPLFFSWREHPDNPRHGLLPIGSQSLSRLHLHFPAPGRYQFNVRVSDGDLMSFEAPSITVYVPGRKGVVGFTPSDGIVRVPDATIRVYHSLADLQINGNPADVAVSDSLGQYVLENLSPENESTGRTYWYVVERPGFQSSSELSMTIHPDPGFGKHRRDEAIGRGRVASVSGYVRNPDGDPVVNATVAILPGPTGLIHAVSTDSSGFFRISDVPKGSWVMQLLADGYRSEVRDVNVSDDMPLLSHTLSPATETAVLAGKVRLSGTDRPVANARVSLSNWIESLTDEQGSFSFSGIPAGDYVLFVTRDGFEPVRLPVLRVRHGTKTLDVPISFASGGPMIYGTITDSTSGSPVRRATVGIVSAGDLLSRSDVTDATGFFQLRDVPLGSQIFRAGAPGYRTRTFSTLVDGAFEMNLVLDRDGNWNPPPLLQEGLPEAAVASKFVHMDNLQESVILDASPSTGEDLLYLWKENPGNPLLGFLPAGSERMETLEIGGFRRPGVYLFELRVKSNGLVSANTAVITVFAPGLAGNVHASPSDGVFGLNAATVRAYSSYQDALTWSVENLIDSVQTLDRPMGDFIMEGLAPGSYWLVARGESGSGFNQYGPVRRQVNHSAAAREIRINLPRDEFSMEGMVRDELTHIPLENARLVVAPGSLSESFRTTTDATGTYRMAAVPRGAGQPVMLMRDGYKTKVSFLDVGGDKIRDFTLSPNSTGQLATLTGRVAAEYKGVLLPVSHAEIIIGSGLARAFTDGEGYYVIQSLPPGQYYGVIRKPGYLPAGLSSTAFLTLKPGGNTLDKVLAFQAPGPVVRGVVVNQYHEPIPGARVTLLPPAGSFTLWSGEKAVDDPWSGELSPASHSGPDLTDSGGVFQLNGVPHGERLVEIRLPDGRVMQRTVLVEGNMEVVWNASFDDYDSWRLRNFGPHGASNRLLSGETADPNRDGVPNLLKYVFGNHPMDVSNPSENFRLETDQNGTMYFRFSRSVGISDITYFLESSADLAVWSRSEVIPRRVASLGNGLEMVEVKVPETDGLRLFWRLQVMR